ncbi:MAG: YhcH/YjgK/YiaL family protein [Lachnospiraceae bacterium]|nr:YhcH/YjgK/YiaL family protein [Lachnospiraceae bacterium]
MIYDKISRITHYKGMHPHLDPAIDYIAAHAGDLPKEHLDLKETDVYSNTFQYDTVPDDESFFEAHRAYADIHLMLSGTERIAVSHISVLEEEEAHPEDDFWKMGGKEEVSLVLDPSSFLIVLPEEAHKLKMITDGAPAPVTKCVFKIKMA